jgi:hypothetical protein
MQVLGDHINAIDVGELLIAFGQKRNYADRSNKAGEPERQSKNANRRRQLVLREVP